MFATACHQLFINFILTFLYILFSPVTFDFPIPLKVAVKVSKNRWRNFPIVYQFGSKNFENSHHLIASGGIPTIFVLSITICTRPQNSNSLRQQSSTACHDHRFVRQKKGSLRVAIIYIATISCDEKKNEFPGWNCALSNIRTRARWNSSFCSRAIWGKASEKFLVFLLPFFPLATSLGMQSFPLPTDFGSKTSSISLILFRQLFF